VFSASPEFAYAEAFFCRVGVVAETKTGPMDLSFDSVKVRESDGTLRYYVDETGVYPFNGKVGKPDWDSQRLHSCKWTQYERLKNKFVCRHEMFETEMAVVKGNVFVWFNTLLSPEMALGSCVVIDKQSRVKR
jgi:hypothetical protein